MPPESYRAVFEANVPARMRDGVTLYADVWRPEAPGRFPILLTRTPYDKQQARTLDVAGVNPMRAVGHGFSSMVANCSSIEETSCWCWSTS